MTTFYTPPNASIAHRWLVRQLGNGPVSFNELWTLAKRHGIAENALTDAAIEAEVHRHRLGAFDETWSMFAEEPPKQVSVAATVKAPRPAAPNPSSATTSYRPPTPAPKPAGPPPLSNAQLRVRMDSVLWQAPVKGREAMALAAIAQPGIAGDKILELLHVTNPVHAEASWNLGERIRVLAWHKESDGREALTLHLIGQTHITVDAAIETLRAAARDTSGQPKIDAYSVYDRMRASRNGEITKTASEIEAEAVGKRMAAMVNKLKPETAGDIYARRKAEQTQARRR